MATRTAAAAIEEKHQEANICIQKVWQILFAHLILREPMGCAWYFSTQHRDFLHTGTLKFNSILPVALCPVLANSSVQPESKFLALFTNQDDLGQFDDTSLQSLMNEANRLYREFLELNDVENSRDEDNDD